LSFDSIPIFGCPHFFLRCASFLSVSAHAARGLILARHLGTCAQHTTHTTTKTSGMPTLQLCAPNRHAKYRVHARRQASVHATSVISFPHPAARANQIINAPAELDTITLSTSNIIVLLKQLREAIQQQRPQRRGIGTLSPAATKVHSKHQNI
jgi:hypothetical protein